MCCLTVSLISTATSSLAAPPTVGGCQILPANNYWNTPVDTLPVHASSAAWINSIGAATQLHADWGNKLNDGGNPPINEIVQYGIPFTTVASPLPSSSVVFGFAGESDPGPYPVPTTAPIEGGPASVGDRHVITIDTSNCVLYELYRAFPSGPLSWTAGSGARWPLNSNASRTDGWTSADAAGLAIFPGLVRWEEVAAGEINHAIRFTAANIWASNGGNTHKYIWPARHWSGTQNNPNLPPMGARVRLKASFNISAFDSRTQVILRAFKKYGMVLADGGSNWYFSGVSNVNWPDIVIQQLNGPLIRGSDFEVVDTLPLQIDPNSEQAVQPPGVPTNFAAIAGNGQATFSFAPPVDSGGKPVLDYTVTCGAFTGTAATSPIVLGGLANGVALSCSVVARNLVFSSAPSAAINVTPGLPATPPGAPTIDFSIVGNGQLSIFRSAPASDGGSPIAFYTATCVNGGSFSVSETDRAITIGALTNGVTYACTVTATNSAGTSQPSSPVNLTPDAMATLSLVHIRSRKTHTGIGAFSIDIGQSFFIDLTAVEPRAIGSGHTIYFRFTNIVDTVGGVTVTDNTGASVSSTASPSGNEVIVTIPSLADNKRIAITLNDIVGPNGTLTTAAPFPLVISFLVGDSNGSRKVNASDISAVKARSGQTTSLTNFKFDVNTSGTIGSTDVSAVKARSGLALP